MQAFLCIQGHSRLTLTSRCTPEKKMTEEKKETKQSKGVSRREFIEGTVGTAAALGAMTSLIPGVSAATPTAAGTETSASPALSAGTAVRASPISVPTSWSYTADVVVVGTGLAGLAAAVAAHDAGASVLILEKLSQALEGGNSKVAGNGILAFMDLTQSPPVPAVAQGAAYLQAVACGRIDDVSIFTAQAQGYVDNLAWIKSLGGTLGTYTSSPSYPSAPGSSYYHTFAIALPGAPVQGNGYPVAQMGDARLWQLLRDNVSSRNINVLYQTPATDLIQNGDTKEILGVKALSNYSEVLNIKANRGVVLACGSIEFAFDLQRQYWPAAPIYSAGSPGNTGDGIKMALKVGADLWHLAWQGAISYGVFIIPGTDPTVSGTVNVTPVGIQVNKFGNRFNTGTAVNGPLGGFANEFNVSVTWDSTTLDWDSIPCWAIFDDTIRKKAPIISYPQVTSTTPGVTGKMGWFTWHSGQTWSADNSAEVAKGWILSANDLNTLAAMIAADPDNRGKMTGAQLTATVTAYNQDVASKSDAQFFTSPSLLTAINGPPFYAMKLWPASSSGSAGPRRNTLCQVLDPSKHPIPRLYSAGELGHFSGWAVGGGCHLAENLFTGRVAGNNASLENPWS